MVAQIFWRVSFRSRFSAKSVSAKSSFHCTVNFYFLFLAYPAFFERGAVLVDSVQMRVGSDKTLVTGSRPTPLMTYLNKVGLLHPLQTRLVMVDGPPPPVPVAALFRGRHSGSAAEKLGPFTPWGLGQVIQLRDIRGLSREETRIKNGKKGNGILWGSVRKF